MMSSEKRDYGYVNNKTINYDELQIFRDIPCNKSIYYAITLMYINNVKYNEFNILEAMTLKLIKYNKISFKKFRNHGRYFSCLYILVTIK